MMTTGTTNIVTEITQQIDRLIAARALLMTGETLPPAASSASSASHISIVDSMGERTIHEVTHPSHQSAKAQSAKATRSRQPRKLSPAARQRISEAQAKRWRKFHREQKAKKVLANREQLKRAVARTEKKAQVA